MSQLTTVTDEKGEKSNNAMQDCVASEVDALCRYVLGTPENSVFNPDAFKDKAYSDAYVGATAAEKYVDECKALGVNLYRTATPSFVQSVALARDLIVNKKQPCVFTRDDPYVDARVHPDWTHVNCFIGADDNGLIAHDPWVNQRVYKTDATWAELLRSTELWLAERIETEVRIDLNTPGVSDFFAPSGNAWQCKQTGKIIHGAILEEYQQRGWSAMWGLPKSNETPIESFPQFAHLAGKGIVVQWFERMAVAYDPEHLLPGEPPPNSGAVYPLQLFGEGPGIDPRLRQARAELAGAQAEITQLKAQPVPTQDPKPLLDLHQIKQIVQAY